LWAVTGAREEIIRAVRDVIDDRSKVDGHEENVGGSHDFAISRARFASG
jgi:hypothetical protein